MKQVIKKRYFLLTIFISLISSVLAQDITITIDANQNKRAVSPYLYGRNNSFDKPAQFYNDVGLKFARMNQGNNATKYNWRKKISSHPDWYNNVYENDWDKKSLKVADNHPNMQVMWAFQLLGRVASSTEHNFNDWAYNSSQWWQGVHQNLAGGGQANEANPEGEALVDGDVQLYTEEWPADSTVEILNHWFANGGLGLDKKQFRYWSMDNEPDIWNGTHNDVMTDGLLPASEFIDRYVAVAKKARAIYPDIKICGPVVTNEWQWYRWGDEELKIDGKYYCWLEYFIKRLADEEKASGIRMVDVIDLHNYPYASNNADALQFHRMYYDQNYVYPGANGVKTINGGWDSAQDKEYIFLRISNWLNNHFGENHGVKIALSEWGTGVNDPNIASVVYASHLGTFANNGIEFFTPWNWQNGMWEVLHLFSTNAKNFSVSSVSTNENTVSAYTTINNQADSMTIMLVNRDMNAGHEVSVNLEDCAFPDGNFRALQLTNLPSGETFKSSSDNALQEKNISLNSNSFTIKVPQLSTTAVILSEGTVGLSEIKTKEQVTVYPNPATGLVEVGFNSSIPEFTHIKIFDQTGRKLLVKNVEYNGFSPINVDVSCLQNGIYFLSVQNSCFYSTQKITVNH